MPPGKDVNDLSSEEFWGLLEANLDPEIIKLYNKNIV